MPLQSGPVNDGAGVASQTGWADNAGVRIHWALDRRPGGGQPLLLINGLGSPLVAFEDGFIEALVARGFAVARFDNRDTGRSDRVVAGGPGASTSSSAAPYSLSDMAADARAVLDALGWPWAHVLGQSMGGMIAQQLAIDHPARVRSLLPLMTSSGEPGFGRPTDEALEALLQPAPPERAAWLAHRVATERIWASPEQWSEPWVRAKAEAIWDHGIDHRGTFRQFRAVRAGGSRDEALAELSVPTLVLHGSADTLISPDGGQHLADVIPGARYQEIDGLGHDLPPGLWPPLVDAVADFVATVGPGY